MATKTRILISFSALALAAAGFYVYSVFAAQGSGTLAQAPMNIQANIKPAFIMAVDDSGSMTFQTMFPGQDGEACWDSSSGSFFDSNGKLLIQQYDRRGNGIYACDYFYVLPGARVNSYPRIPPLDSLGFARSPDFNPSFFDPDVTYDPWINQDMASYGNADLSNTKIDPRETTTISLFSEVSDGQYVYRMQNGMYIPPSVTYKSGSNWKTTGSQGLVWSDGGADVYFKYQPAIFFLKANRTIAGYNNLGKVDGACGSGCSLWKYEPATNAAKQNFANWFSYYGNRNRAMIAGMTRAMADVRDMRVGYFTINSGGSKYAYADVAMKDMNSQDGTVGKPALYASMLALGASGGTPNRWAVNHIGSQFMRTDKDAPIQNQCQKNSGMLFTDGYSNNGGPTADAVNGLGIPFDPTPANTMAAIATKYYQTNLRSDLLPGKVRIPEACSKLTAGSTDWKRLDCNANLHMNFFGITLGARGNLYDPTVEKDPYTDSTVYGNWPVREDDQRSTVDDIWHAAVNSRGEYINARSPVDITSAMRRVLASAGGGSTPSGSLGLTGSRIGSGSFTVTPSYTARNESTDWSSTLQANAVSTNVLTGEATYSKLWDATDAGKIPAATGRTIYRAKTTAGVVPDVAPFDATNVSFDDLCTDSLARCTKSGSTNGMTGSNSRLKLGLADAIAYLKGEQGKEVQNGGNLRDRSTRLGDIVNSTPVISSPFLDYGYRSLRTISSGVASYPFQSSYTTFLASKATSDKPMVYAGANDGMLHAFDGKTGAELFAYIPATALGHMGNLLFPYVAADKQNQVFSHTYYVDGPVTVSDAYYGGGWKSVLVGTAGAGGRGVFALDVTNPDSFGSANVLWEINDQVNATATNNSRALKNDIGSVLAKPVIVPVRIGNTTRWKAIFGNGYNSVNRKAVLFVADVETGAVTSIVAAESGRDAFDNGLGNVIVLDRWIGDAKGASQAAGRDGFADTVYAADQNGAVWKFDLRDNSVPSSPFFIATDNGGARQPILGGLEAAAGPGGGVMLYFGTGSFSFDGDKTDTQLQSFYGVLDRGSNVTRSQLARQEITEAAGKRSLTANAMNAFGWFIDLGVKSGTGYVQAGERVVGYPRVESGIVFFTTYAPQSTADCAGDGYNRIYGVGALSGASVMDQVRIGTPTGSTPDAGANGFLLNTGGSAPVKDIAVMSTPRQDPLSAEATPEAQAAALAARCSMVVQVAGAPPMYMPRACGRQSWRQVR